jgi:hypothetical protein
MPGGEEKASTDCVTWRELTPHLETLKDVEKDMKELQKSHNEQNNSLRDIRLLLVILILVSAPNLATGLMTLVKGH